MRLFYFVTDSHPAWRVDVSELFPIHLRRLGVETTWSMRRDDSGLFRRVAQSGQDVYLPFAIAGIPVISPIVRRLGEIAGEILLSFKLLFGKRFEFIQVRDDRYTAAFFGLLSARLRRTRFIYWLSFPFPDNDLLKAQQTSGAKSALLRLRGLASRWWLYKVILPAADHVFVQSDKMKSDMVAQGVPEDRMTAVPMGVPPRLLQWIATSAPVIEKERIVYLGTLARSRRLDTMLEAFSLVLDQFPNAKLHIVGRGDTPADRVALETECERLGISDNVTFAGFLPLEEAWSIAASAAVCISPFVPSPVLDSASPTKLIEYMALGRPVVANSHPEQSLVLSESGAGLCVRWDAKAFADAIIGLLSHPEEAEAMGARGPDWVAENRSYDNLAELVFQRYLALHSEC